MLPAHKAYHFIEFPKQHMVIHRILNYNFCFYSFCFKKVYISMYKVKLFYRSEIKRFKAKREVHSQSSGAEP